MSEVYLIAAEASLPTNEADAKTYVNFITSRRGASAITSTGSQLFEDIITERRKELAFEGDRYLDLQRLKRDIVRSNNYLPTSRTVPYSVFRRILPIPQTEIDANPAIATQQNPGY
jgi:starch-binding outer membrane protein, SusD/RagB family